MVRDPNREYSVNAFRTVCDETVKNLPEKAKDQSLDWEKRRELVLDQLLARVHRHANSSWVKLGGNDMPRSLYLEDQILHVLQEDWGLDNFENRPIIQACVKTAIGDKQP